MFIRALGGFLLMAVVAAEAGQLVSASFSSGSEPESLTGINPEDSALKPDGANVTGENWVLAGGGGFDVWLRENAARMHNGGAVAIPLREHTAKAIVTIAADITFEQPTASEGEGEESGVNKEAILGGFAVLGFYSAIPKQEFGNCFKDFTGLQVNYDGSLQLYGKGEKFGNPIPFGGTFDPASPNILTYSVDTSTGAVTKVSFGTSTATYDFGGTGFSGGATAYAGFGGSLGNQPLHVEFRDFSVSAEPAGNP